MFGCSLFPHSPFSPPPWNLASIPSFYQNLPHQWPLYSQVQKSFSHISFFLTSLYCGPSSWNALSLVYWDVYSSHFFNHSSYLWSWLTFLLPIPETWLSWRLNPRALISLLLQTASESWPSIRLNHHLYADDVQTLHLLLTFHTKPVSLFIIPLEALPLHRSWP